MKIQGIHLAWIAVADLAGAIKFYTEVVGLTLHEWNKEYGWAELSGPTGSRLGIAQYTPECEVKAGSNAVFTITVDNIEEACEELKTKNARLVGDVLEVPGEVKMQTVCDADGNTFQVCELLRKDH